MYVPCKKKIAILLMVQKDDIDESNVKILDLIRDIA